MANLLVALSCLLAWEYANAEQSSRASLVVEATLTLGVVIAVSMVERFSSHSRPYESSRRERTLGDDFPAAIDGGELVLHMQPIVRARDGVRVGAECLLRWEHADYGHIPPPEIVAAALAAGRVMDLHRWVCHHSLEQGAVLIAHLNVEDPLVSFNVSPLAFRSGFAASIRDLMQTHGLRAHGMVLEITEQDAFRPSAEMRYELAQLRDLGFRIAFDDFGAGYLNLRHLNEVEVDIVKIDQTLLEAALNGPRGAAVLQATIELVRSIGATVLLEGVEEASVAEHAVAQGVDYIQGYGFGRPSPLQNLLLAHNGT